MMDGCAGRCKKQCWALQKEPPQGSKTTCVSRKRDLAPFPSPQRCQVADVLLSVLTEREEELLLEVINLYVKH